MESDRGEAREEGSVLFIERWVPVLWGDLLEVTLLLFAVYRHLPLRTEQPQFRSDFKIYSNRKRRDFNMSGQEEYRSGPHPTHAGNLFDPRVHGEEVRGLKGSAPEGE